MKRRPDLTIAVIACAVLLQACPGPTGVIKNHPATPFKSRVPIVGIAALPLDKPTRLIGDDAPRVQLTGKVKLVSDQGSAIISNNGGNLISDRGGSIISNNSGSLKAATALRARTLLATSPPAESLLADAVVEVLDGAGQILVDAHNKPITAVTDRQGAYRLDARLPKENLVLRVRLGIGTRTKGGQLTSLLPHQGEGVHEVDLDTASSLGASYVLDKYVKNRPAVFERLPAIEADALRRDILAARNLVLAMPSSYRAEELVALAEDLRTKVPAVDQTFSRIQAILLAGQSELGEGQAATKVALSNVFGIVGDPRTTPPTLFTGEVGRVRRIAPDGTIHRLVGGTTRSIASEGDPLTISLDSPGNLAIAPDGTLYICDYVANRVFRLKDGQVTVLAGNGSRQQGAVGGLARETAVRGPSQPIVAPDGRIYFGEFPKNRQFDGRILFVEPDGRLGELPGPFVGPPSGSLVTGLALAPDGTFYLLDSESSKIGLWKRDLGGTWTRVLGNLPIADTSRITVGPDGAVYMSQGLANRVVRVAADGTVTVVAGNGTAGDQGDGGPANMASLNEPSGLWFAPDGTLYIADFGNALVRTVSGGLDGTGTIRTVAGTRAATQLGDALTLPLNTPTGLALDPAGHLLVAEGAGGTIKRLEGAVLSVFAGSTRGLGGDGGPANRAQFNLPGSLASIGPDLYVLDTGNSRIRKIAGDGTVSTVVGESQRGFMSVPRALAAASPAATPLGAAVSPSGLLYWCENAYHQILRLTADGYVEVLAGGLHNDRGDRGDGGLATEALVSSPIGLAFDRRGDLYICDSGNTRIRRIGADGRIDTVVGLPIAQVLGKMLAKEVEPTGEQDARDAWLLGPTAICFDKQDALYIAELGSARIGTLAGALGLPLAFDNLPKHGSRIRKVTGLDTANPRIRTIAGEGAALLGGPDADNALLVPLGMVVDADGRLIIADSGSNQLKLLPAGSY